MTTLTKEEREKIKAEMGCPNEACMDDLIKATSALCDKKWKEKLPKLLAEFFDKVIEREYDKLYPDNGEPMAFDEIETCLLKFLKQRGMI